MTRTRVPFFGCSYFKHIGSFFVTFLVLQFLTSPLAWGIFPPDNSTILPDSRRIQWDPGVRGSIPLRASCGTLSSGSTASQIQNKLNDVACQGKAVVLNAGIYNIDKAINIPSNVTLRGAGMGQTILKGTGTFSGNSLILFDSGFDESWSAAEKSLVNPSKGSSTIETSTDHGWTAGNVVLIDMATQPAGDPPVDISGNNGNCNWCGRPNRPFGQWVKILTTPTTKTATIDPPLYWSYANTPVGVQMTGLTQNAGVEDLTLNNLVSDVQDTVGIFGAINSWLLRVELKGNHRRAVWTYGALWFTFQGCKIWGGVPTPDVAPNPDGSDAPGVVGKDYDDTTTLEDGEYHSDRAYGIFLGPHVSASLIVDNIFEKLTMAVAWEGAASGNVVSYNYMGEMWWESTDGDYPRRFGPLMHGPHPFMNLLEGNYSIERFRTDETWGTSSHFVLLRNRFMQRNRGVPYAQAWVVDIERRNRYYSLIGNILGTKGLETEYELNNQNASYGCNGTTNDAADCKAIYKLGYKSLGSSPTAPLYDMKVRESLFRCKNWVSQVKNPDTFADTDASYPYRVTVSGSGIEKIAEKVSCPQSTIIPSSFYLTSRPDWFKDPASGQPLVWPPLDSGRPETEMECPIPAQLRANPGISVPTRCLLTATSGSPPSPPRTIQIH